MKKLIICVLLSSALTHTMLHRACSMTRTAARMQQQQQTERYIQTGLYDKLTQKRSLQPGPHEGLKKRAHSFIKQQRKDLNRYYQVSPVLASDLFYDLELNEHTECPLAKNLLTFFLQSRYNLVAKALKSHTFQIEHAPENEQFQRALMGPIDTQWRSLWPPDRQDVIPQVWYRLEEQSMKPIIRNLILPWCEKAHIDCHDILKSFVTYASEYNVLYAALFLVKNGYVTKQDVNAFFKRDHEFAYYVHCSQKEFDYLLKQRFAS